MGLSCIVKIKINENGLPEMKEWMDGKIMDQFIQLKWTVTILPHKWNNINQKLILASDCFLLIATLIMENMITL